MNMQALLIRTAVFVALCLGMAIAAMQHEPTTVGTAQAPGTRSLTAPTLTMPAATALVATVVLPTVNVRPTAEDMAAAAREATISADSANSGDLSHVTYAVAIPALPDLRMDMPYFSFGKVVSRANKE